jgi:hypothetical protein
MSVGSGDGDWTGGPEGLAGVPEIAAGLGNVSSHLLGVADDRQPVVHQPLLLPLRHWFSFRSEDPDVSNVRQFLETGRFNRVDLQDDFGGGEPVPDLRRAILKKTAIRLMASHDVRH